MSGFQRPVTRWFRRLWRSFRHSSKAVEPQPAETMGQPGTPSDVQHGTLLCSDNAKRRNKIIEDMANKVRYVTTSALMQRLGLDEQWLKFSETYDECFADIASTAPKRSGEHLVYPEKVSSEMVEAKIASCSGKSTRSSREALGAHFKWLWKRMQQDTEKSSWPGIKQRSPLVYTDLSERPATGPNIKPDGVFVAGDNKTVSFRTAQTVLVTSWKPFDEKKIPADVLGELGDYALHIWTEQLALVYVPVLLLHGEKLSLVAFTRRKVYIACLGPILSLDGSTKTELIRQTLRCLWFFATVDSVFKQYCGIEGDFPGIRFSKPDHNGITRISRTHKPTGNGFTSVHGRIKSPVYMFGRISYLYRVTFESKDAVLKFTYMPVTQLPEGAVYQLLKESCKGLIPEVYASGVIAHEWSGYRPVFLITEYCGVAVDRFAQAQRSNYQTLDHVEGLICNAIKRSSNCIAKAYSVGVLHRNIAPKNILIKDECVKIVGWGSSRLRTDTEVNGIAALGRTWRFNTEAVLAEELQYDTVIYASSFTSIQVFLGTSSRDLMHDLESLFYVALHSLATFNGNVGDNKPSPYRPSLHEGRLTAAARIGCLSNEASYLQNFGVAGCHLAMAKVFDAMYRFLFFSSGVFIAGSFLTDPNRKRVRDVGVASGFMDSRLLLSPKEAGDLLVPLGQEITRAGGEASLVRADKRRNSDGDQNNPVAKRPRHME